VPVTLHFRSREKQTMKTLYIAVLTLVMITAASAQNQTTFRDASGRTTGTVTTDSNGTRTFRDGSGRTTGTATTDSNGTTTFRDGAGRTTGTASTPRR
jgi:YD repeat-containing protein